MNTSNSKAAKIRVVGIDPSPGKLSTIFDGEEFRRLDAEGLCDYLDKLDARSLVCWDAPLTGPANPDVVIAHDGNRRPYTQRRIEQFFSTNRRGIKAPKGISVLPYSGCSHWTLSRALLGLPRVGKWDQPLQNLPFELVERNDAKERDWTRPKVVEVHPALALFLWSKRSSKNSSWEYKKNSEVFKDVRKTFLNSVKPLKMPVPQDDDQLDALVAYVLGNRWLDGNGVVLLGNKDTGHFLIPSKWGSEDVSKKFSNFLTDC